MTVTCDWFRMKNDAKQIQEAVVQSFKVVCDASVHHCHGYTRNDRQH